LQRSFGKSWKLRADEINIELWHGLPFLHSSLAFIAAAILTETDLFPAVNPNQRPL